MSAQSDFSLRKWYLDCVADNGDSFIGYSAALRWKALNVRYASVLTQEEEHGVRAEMSLRRNPSPYLQGGHVHWSHQTLNVRGTWKRLSEPIHRHLYGSPDGAITWSCLLPRADVDASFGKDGTIRGLGYAEVLDLTLSPRQLPFTELRWGRFLSRGDALVWIEWGGAVPLSLVFLNGMQVEHASISDGQITIDNGRTVLLLADSTELRAGSLVSSALSLIPGVAAIVPSNILRAHEYKWRSRGFLNTKGTTHSTGWAIHERVTFPPV